MKRKKLMTVLVAVFSVAVFLGTFILIWFWGDQYEDFNEFSEAAAIPGLNEGAVPQGLANYTSYMPAVDGKEQKNMQEYYFISAYMKKGPSRIYVTGSRTGYVGYVNLANEDGSDYTGHCGGIATNCTPSSGSGTLWVVSEGRVYCAGKSSDKYLNIAEEVIEKAASDENKTVRFTAGFNANCNADFCFYYDYDGNPLSRHVTEDKLYVGEFYRRGSSETDAGHHITTKNGSHNKAFVYEYKPDFTSKYGLQTLTADNIADEYKVPKIQYVFSVPEKIQGFARVCDSSSTSAIKGELVLSQSWGLSNSSLYCFDFESVRSTDNSELYSVLAKQETGEAKNLEYEGIITKSGARYYDNPRVYFVDEQLAKRTYSIPSMSEGLCVNGNKVYVLFESASYKYKTFVRQQLNNIYGFVPRR